MYDKAPLHPPSAKAPRSTHTHSLHASLRVARPEPAELLAAAFGVSPAVIRHAVSLLAAPVAAQALPGSALISANLYSLDAARRLRAAAQGTPSPISGVAHE